MGIIHVKLNYFGKVVLKDMSFKEIVYGRTTDDGQRPITIANIEPSAQLS